MTPSPRSRTLAAAAGLLLALAPALPAQPAVRLPAADRPLAGRAAPVFAVGGRGELEEAGSVAFDARDRLYVLDTRARSVRVFSPAGTPVRQFGAGELRLPVRMAVLGDGGVAVADLGRMAVIVFGPDGALRRTVPFDRMGGVPGIGGMQGHPRGGVVATVHQRDRATSLRWSGLGTAGEARPLFQGRPPAQVMRDFDENGVRFDAPVPVTFAPAVLWSVLPSGQVAVSQGTGYRVELRDAEGTPLRALVRPLPSRRVTERDRERAREERMAQVGPGARVIGMGGSGGGTPMSAGAFQAQLTRMVFADTMPVLQGLVADPAGVLWIARAAAVHGDPGPVDLVTPSGSYLGTLARERLPDAISPGGLAAYLEKGASPRVSVRRLPAAWRGQR